MIPYSEEDLQQIERHYPNVPEWVDMDRLVFTVLYGVNLDEMEELQGRLEDTEQACQEFDEENAEMRRILNEQLEALGDHDPEPGLASQYEDRLQRAVKKMQDGDNAA